MAAKKKTATAAKKKATTKKKEVKEKNLPNRKLVQGDEFSVVLNANELLSLIQLLSFSKDVFENMAINTLRDGGDKVVQASYSARAQLSLALSQKFRDLANIGEPQSREVH
jgi:hypothetical protein